MECMHLLCWPGNQTQCQLCQTPMTVEHRRNWNAYIDLIESNWEDDNHPYSYYSDLRERPICCTISKDQYCRLHLVNEPMKEPNKFYDLTCVKDNFLGRLLCNNSTGNRCCTGDHCNIPTLEELALLKKGSPFNYQLQIVLPVVIVVLFILFPILFYFMRRNRCRSSGAKSATSTKLNYVDDKSLPDASTGLLTPSYYSGSAGTVPPNSALVAPPVLSGATNSAICSNHRNVGGGCGGSSLGSYLSNGMPASTVATPRYYSFGANSGGITGSMTTYCSLTPNTTTTAMFSAGGRGTPSAASTVPFTTGADSSLSLTLRGLLENYSGSGSGVPLLVQRTVARQVQLEERIGEGRYGDVWRGVWQCDPVAAKIFSSRDERSWVRETEIYQTVMLRHANILGFIAADNKDNGVAMELWLITEYHPLGSLFDFLHEHCWLPAALLRAVASIANGLAHLHMEITGTQGKPAIAHRDLKSRNILVKMDGECCIGDLGFALKLDSASLRSNEFTATHSDRVGTKRYMAPEVLDNTVRHTAPEAFKQADMYSLGLIFWEMTQRCYTYGLCGPEEYQLPYQDHVAHDPSVEEMKTIVCEQGMRPHLQTVWSRHQILDALQSIMTECWYANPQARLPAMRVKKSLATVRKQIELNPGLSVSPPASLLPPRTCSHVLPPGVLCYPCVPIQTTSPTAATIGQPLVISGNTNNNNHGSNSSRPVVSKTLPPPTTSPVFDVPIQHNWHGQQDQHHHHNQQQQQLLTMFTDLTDRSDAGAEKASLTCNSASPSSSYSSPEAGNRHQRRPFWARSSTCGVGGGGSGIPLREAEDTLPLAAKSSADDVDGRIAATAVDNPLPS